MAIKNNIVFALKEVREKIEFNDDNIREITVGIKSLHLFDEVKDFRQQTKISYKLDDLLLLSFLVMLETGKQYFEYIADHIEVNHKKYEELGLLREGKYPSHDTFRRIFSLMDSESLIDTTINRLCDFLNELDNKNKKNSLTHYSIDGKFANGSGRSDNTLKPQENLNVLNFYNHTYNTCFFSVVVGEKTNEIPIAQQILSKMNLKGCVITADALHCQKETCAIIKSRSGHYALTVKDNQGTLFDDIKAKFNNEKNIDKIKAIYDETKKIKISVLVLPKGYDNGFTGIRSFAMMESYKKKKDEPCIRYFITDLVKPEDIFKVINERWCLETHHQIKDVYLHEDEFRCTDKKAVRNMAIMNNLIVQLLQIYIPLSGMIPRKAKIALRSNPIEQMGILLSMIDSDTIRNKMIESTKK